MYINITSNIDILEYTLLWLRWEGIFFLVDIEAAEIVSIGWALLPECIEYQSIQNTRMNSVQEYNSG